MLSDSLVQFNMLGLSEDARGKINLQDVKCNKILFHTSKMTNKQLEARQTIYDNDLVTNK